MKEYRPLEQPGVNNLERKRQKRESSRLSVFIYPSQLLRAGYDRDRQFGDQHRCPNLFIRIRYTFPKQSHPKVGDENALEDRWSYQKNWNWSCRTVGQQVSTCPH
ncbi:hypothetical protein AVEN_260203-1 [Araneus ventricosus]|uniref:Uncharacterized protein n=1 Tax=Araneus ventricosus TaxID=182803 RepID=A0A4Y2VMP6_ARAVE|nr:hypothetical protein AVEN_260203-1 [Araneus ventricosus]